MEGIRCLQLGGSISCKSLGLKSIAANINILSFSYGLLHKRSSLQAETSYITGILYIACNPSGECNIVACDVKMTVESL